jgi:hypothetical protein
VEILYVTRRNLQSREVTSCDRKKLPEKEETSCHNKKSPITGRNFLSHEEAFKD